LIEGETYIIASSQVVKVFALLATIAIVHLSLYFISQQLCTHDWQRSLRSFGFLTWLSYQRTLFFNNKQDSLLKRKATCKCHESKLIPANFSFVFLLLQPKFFLNFSFIFGYTCNCLFLFIISDLECPSSVSFLLQLSFFFGTLGYALSIAQLYSFIHFTHILLHPSHR